MKVRPFLPAAIVVVGLLEAAAAGQPQPIAVLTDCLITPKSDVDVPAEDAGVLVSVAVSEGMQVGKDYLLGKIDDIEPRMAKELAEFERQAAEKEAKNTVNIEYARAAAEVADATVAEREAANRKTSGTVTRETLRKLKLEAYRSKLAIKQEHFNQALAAITAKARATDVKAAETKIKQRHIKSPIDGLVVAIMKHAGEWVAPGDAIMRIVHFDTLWVEGFLDSGQYDPRDVDGRPVTIEVELARGRHEKFSGRVVYASQLIQTGGGYQVRAEVKNREEHDQWILRPGQFATMRIHVGEEPVGEETNAQIPAAK